MSDVSQSADYAKVGACITIRTGARLHFGPLSYRPTRGRHFGGIGLMIEEPGCEVTVRSAVDGQQSRLPVRVQDIQDRIAQQFPDAARNVTLSMQEELPEHSGLGSGTQVSLAVAEALLLRSGISLDERQLAVLTGRGRRSGIGIAGYAVGGFLVDAGNYSTEDLSEIAAREPFPEQWPIILVQPRTGQGHSGLSEEHSLAELPPLSLGESGDLCRLVLTEMLPALRAVNFQQFVGALNEYGRRIGRFFAPVQGGQFSSPVIRELSGLCASTGVSEFLQSSWGPTAVVLAQDDQAAQRFSEQLSQSPFASQVDVCITRARNRGREVRMDAGSG